MFGETAYGLCGNGAIHGSIHCRVYFSGPTFLVLAEISLDRGYPPLLKYTLIHCHFCLVAFIHIRHVDYLCLIQFYSD